TQFDEELKKNVVSIWIYEEDAIDRAIEYLEEFKDHPEDPKFAKVEFPVVPPQPPDLIAQQREANAQKEAEKLGSDEKMAYLPPTRKKRVYPLTYFVILLCVLLYFWSGAERVKMIKTRGKLSVQIGLMPLQQKLLFDYPKSKQVVDELLKKYPLTGVKELSELPSEYKAALDIPTWTGLLGYWFKKQPGGAATNGPLFEKIRKGELWRLFTPCLLHGGFLHILFNMAWAWLLLRQVEDRLSKWKIGVLILLIGIVANVAQYFVSGPYFLGFSGVVCGLVGFIWVRQKMAPWEGYPLHKSTIIFILIFVGAMFALEIVSLITAAITAKEISANIANTAHIVGGLVGAFLGRVPFFSRGMQ
ncbi:MAG: hypothetical protein K1000chlam2_01758, partial [Chlamydiae bacterium]|nr:hypothetical protein [Chlamydiota bacterium]